MRKYLVYIKPEGSQGEPARSHITPCYELDKQFWAEQEGRELYVIGSCSSLAMAFAVREEINRRLGRASLTKQRVEELRQAAVGYVRETNRVYARQQGDQKTGTMPSFHFTVLEKAEGASCGVPPLSLAEVKRAAWLVHGAIGGRALFLDEIERMLERIGGNGKGLPYSLQLLVLRNRIVLMPGVRLSLQRGLVRHRLALYCQRCGNEGEMSLGPCEICEQLCSYCPRCIDMGRSKCCTPYFLASLVQEASLPVRSRENMTERYLAWEGKLSPLQAEAAERARQFVAYGNNPQQFLIWAVCGAGKTELIFPAIEEALQTGGNVLLATPRKDVVLELAPRLKCAFPSIAIIAVHGSSSEKWEEARLVIATTHQVLRFYHRFSLVIVDEVDAFPYRGDPMLYRAVERAVVPGGRRLYLSATPPGDLADRLVQKSGLQISAASPSHVLLPLRFHGYALPVPRTHREGRLEQKLRNGTRMDQLIDAILQSFQAKRQVFLFVPRIDWIELVLRYLGRHLPEGAHAFEGVHAADPEREQKVTAFREKRISLIVTTTILERGVTIPQSDVIVLGADAPVFDEASLVQIAGRVGRSADSPNGTVWFMEENRSQAAVAAIKQIRRMNRLGDRKRQEMKIHAD